ncbi:unnamed protein product [Polarella glacialis]|uniref:Methyltransferase FkbM domain-containing protein n=1 Tax=Polarella glacialis TaxID=89957 RepID=A0A813L797_POLGL|nr:unnamed protein product [Polarella glacialis]
MTWLIFVVRTLLLVLICEGRSCFRDYKHREHFLVKLSARSLRYQCDIRTSHPEECKDLQIEDAMNWMAATHYDALAPFRERCSKNGFRVFELIMDNQKRNLLPSLGTDSWLFQWHYAQTCVPFSCTPLEVLQFIWPLRMQTELGLEKRPVAPFDGSIEFAELTVQTASIQTLQKRGEKPRLMSRRARVPALLLAFFGVQQEHNLLSLLSVSAEASGLISLDLDVKGMSRIGPDRMLRLPATVSSVIVDVGVSIQSEFVERLQSDPTVLLIGFEPLPLAYEAQRSWLERQPASIADRFWLFPVAIAAEPDIVLMHVSNGTGYCSSLLPWNDSSVVVVGGSEECHTEIGQIPVLQVPLAPILSLLPVEVELLKVDAQGFDFEVVLTAGEFLRRVRRVQLELQAVDPGDRRLRYAGQKTKGEIIPRMAGLGFRLENCVIVSQIINEEDCIFARTF